jgi:hypothetical protein
LIIELMFCYSVAANKLNLTEIEDQRPTAISDTSWNSLKQAIEQQKIYSQDGFSDGIGFSISLDPNLNQAIVGAINAKDNGDYSGAAYVFELETSGWVQKAKLLAADGITNQQFGIDVAINADKIAIGAPGTTTSLTGSVYIFSFDGLNWIQTEKLESGDTTNNSFGRSLSLFNNQLLVGDWQAKNESNQMTGAAYLFEYNNSSLQWSQAIKLLADDGAANDLFGLSLELSQSGTRAVIGASFHDANGLDSGAIYVFDKQNNNWLQTAKIIGSNTGANDQFGIKVSVSNDVIISTNYLESVYVFEKINNSWQETTQLTAAMNSGFGRTIKLYEDTIVISRQLPPALLIYKQTTDAWQLQQTISTSSNTGKYELDIQGHRLLAGDYNTGASYYHFEQSPSCTLNNNCSWINAPSISSTDTSQGDGFGISIDISGNRAVIGAYQDDDKGENAGAAYVFEYADFGAGSNWRQVKKLVAFDGEANDSFGRSVAIDDNRLIVGAFQDDYKFVTFDVIDAGAVYVYDFDGTFWQLTQKITSAEGLNSTSDFFGLSIDLDDDRILIGAHGDDENGSNSGATYVYDLIGNSWQKSHKLMYGNSGDAFGYAVSLDSNRALIGAYLNDDIALNAGAAYIFNYNQNTNTWKHFSDIDDLLPNSATTNENTYFGTSVSLEGNFALVGAFFDDLSTNVNENQGSVTFFYKPSHILGWGNGQTYFASDAAIEDRFGYSVSLHGKTALIGSWLDDDNGSQSGSVYVFNQNPNPYTWTETEKIIASDGFIEDYFGVAVALSDIWMMIAAHRDDTPNIDTGSVYIYQQDLIFESNFEFNL